MFHLLLVLPVLAPLLAVYGAIAALLLCAPYWVGLFLEAVLTIVTKKRALLLLPPALGGVCAVGYFFLLKDLVPLWFQFIYWVVFFLCLWLTWVIVAKLKALVLNWLGRK